MSGWFEVLVLESPEASIAEDRVVKASWPDPDVLLSKHANRDFGPAADRVLTAPVSQLSFRYEYLAKIGILYIFFNISYSRSCFMK